MWFLLHPIISPKKFTTLATKAIPWLSIGFASLFLYGLIGGLILAPADYLQSDAFRIIYVHVPCAFLSLLIYAVMTASALVGLVWRIKLGFLVIKHSAPIGAGFTFLSLLTGSLWGKPMWGTWWIWDARLTSQLILLFLYLAILLFQSATASRASGEKSVALLILVGSVDLPIIHYSVYWWNTLHQGATLKLFSPSSIDKSMGYPLIAMIVSFTLYYALIICLRLRNDLIRSTSSC